ncbi:hypothetical protein pb186bvf_014179 [Paramecium bursaria]
MKYGIRQQLLFINQQGMRSRTLSVTMKTNYQQEDEKSRFLLLQQLILYLNVCQNHLVQWVCVKEIATYIEFQIFQQTIRVQLFKVTRQQMQIQVLVVISVIQSQTIIKLIEQKILSISETPHLNQFVIIQNSKSSNQFNQDIKIWRRRTTL